jgi:hypothetical protein
MMKIPVFIQITSLGIRTQDCKVQQSGVSGKSWKEAPERNKKEIRKET